MPRIDPIQLLNCLSILLSPNGGIKSKDEVQRLVGLMTKFSKKLVFKCIYIQILKTTNTELLNLFMGLGGWKLIHMWLTESIAAKNLPLVKELLELLLLCPVDIERLKTNNCPKLVKELSKDESHYAIRALASKLVEQWLKTVKGDQVVSLCISDISKIISNVEAEIKADNVIKIENDIKTENAIKTEISAANCEDKNTLELENQELLANQIKEEKSVDVKEISKDVNGKESDEEPETLPVLKITLKNGKQKISQIIDGESIEDDEQPKIVVEEKHKSKNRDKSNKNSSSSSISISKHSNKIKSSSDKSSSKDKDRHSSSKDRRKEKDRHSSSSSQSSKSKHNSSSSKKSKSKDESDLKKHSDKDKAKEKSSKDRSDREKTEKEITHKTDKGKSNKERLTDKDKVDKETTEKEKIDKVSAVKDEKPQVPSIHKLGKIPKLSDAKREKPSISIEVRKPEDPKPKTVKTFNSKFRKHGLEEEVKPPPSRAALLNKKPPPPAIPPTVSIPKRPSPVHNESPPEKKSKTIDMEKIEKPEKPGSIKLIPPKPKRGDGIPDQKLTLSSKNVVLGCQCTYFAMVLQESDMFMDALNASATNVKKEPKKRKRRTSGSKDGNAPNDGSPPHTPTTPPSSENKSVPPRFYQDTLDEDEAKEKAADKNIESDDSNENKVSEPAPVEEMEVAEPHTLTVNGLKGVLCYHKRKGPKKSIKWKPDSELEEIQYFELDETERVNVTKTFTDMKHLERIHEREAFQKARNLTNDDIMEEKTIWRPLITVDCGDQVQVEHGKNSKEKEIQAIRQKGTLQPLYFHKSMIPDSALEPDPETHTYSEPAVIPLDDITGNVSDFRNMPWPEPKGNAPPTSSGSMNLPSIFPPNMSQFPNNFPPTQFPGIPSFQGPPMMPGDWPNNVPPMIPNGLPGPIGAAALGPPGAVPPGPIPPGAMPPGPIPPGIMVPPDNMMMGPEMFGGPNPMFPIPPDGFNMQPNIFPVDFNMSGPQGSQGPDGFAGPGNFRGAMRGRGATNNWRGKGPANFDGPQRGRGGRGGRKAVCIYFQRKGSCRQGDKCTFLHPGVNCPF